MRWRFRATSSALFALALVAGVARAAEPVDDPATIAERDALIDKIARGQDYDASVKRFAALVHARDKVVATSTAAREREQQARLAAHEFAEEYKKTADSDAGWRCTFSVDPRNPVPSDEGRFKADWGRVVKKEKVTLPPKNALDDGEPATFYEVAGQARRYRFRGDKFGPGFPPRAIDANVGDLMLVCDGGGQLDRASGIKLVEHGFAARIAQPPKIAQKGRWNPIHVTSTRYFWAIHDVKWKYPEGSYVLSDLVVGRDLGGGRWDIPVENNLSFVIEVPPNLPRRDVLHEGHNAWMILGHPRFDRTLKKLVLVVEDLEARYVVEK